MKMSESTKIKILQKLLGEDYIILSRDKYLHDQEENSREITKYRKHIQKMQMHKAEYVFFKKCLETLVGLEEQLHDSDNADDILKATFQTACAFYEADWAGFLELDVEAGIWWPFDWYTVKQKDMTKTYLNEFESIDTVPSWIYAMKQNRAIVIPDINEIRNEFPEEYALYERVKLFSAIAVPVTPRPCGFMVVRNPKRYVESQYASMLQLLAFVALTNINDKMTRRMQKMIKAPNDIHDTHNIYVKLFGEFSLITNAGTLTAADCEWVTTPPFLSYLAIKKNKIHQPYELDSVFFESKNGNMRNVYNMVSHARTDLQPLGKADLIPFAKSDGYKLNIDYHITTDISRFDTLYNDIIASSSSVRTYYNCMQIFEMYTGDIVVDVRDDIVQYLTHDYHTKYFAVLEKLLLILHDSGDYERVRKVAEKGMMIEPDKPEMYFWLIIAYKELHMAHTANEYQKNAEKRLSANAYRYLINRLNTYNKQSDKF